MTRPGVESREDTCGLGRGLSGRSIRPILLVVPLSAALGRVACSQLFGSDGEMGGSRWLVSASLHAPIEQQARLLRDTSAGRALLRFVRGPADRAIIRSHGYSLPSNGVATGSTGEASS